MDDGKASRPSPGSRHERKRLIASIDDGRVDDASPLSTGTAKRISLGNTPVVSSKIMSRNPNFRNPRQAHTQSLSSLSRTTSRLSISRANMQNRQIYQGPTIIERILSQLRLCRDDRLNKVKERFHAWEANGIFSVPLLFPHSFRIADIGRFRQPGMCCPSHRRS